jgi:rhomboid protease GluP
VAGGSTETRVLVGLGANVPSLVLGGEVWRLLASVFLHIGILHLVLNGWALYQLGSLLESLAGGARLLAVFVIGGLAGSVASVAWHALRGQNSLSAGASGAVFALLGALTALLWRRRDRLRPAGRALLSSLGLWAAINIVFGVTTPGIDNAAHLGGALAGLVIGATLKARGDR